MKSFAWWAGCILAELVTLESFNRCSHHFFELSCYPGGYPTLCSYLLIPIVVIPMWALHERLGWFGGYQSSSDMPRVHVHPRHDKV